MVVERALAAKPLHTHTHFWTHVGQYPRMHKTWRETAGAGGVGEIGRTSANGQKVYGNDPDNEKAAARGRESERDKCECDKVTVRRGERETFLTACCFWIERRANEKWR